VNTAFNAAWTITAQGGSLLATCGLPKDYFREEIEWVIRGRGCRQFTDYLQLKRSGRGTPLGEKLRAEVWALYDEYRHQLQKRRTHDFSALIEYALREVRERGRPTEYAAVIVDEAQDLTEMGMKLVYELAGRDRADCLLILGDGQQSIYPGGFSLGSIGIDVRGRSTVLTTNYRNTAEILAAAMEIVEGRPYDDLEAGLSGGPRDVSVLRRGTVPERRAFGSIDDHDLALGEAILASAGRPDISLGDIAVLVPTKNLVVRYAELLRGLGLNTQLLEDYQGVPNSLVKVGTFKRSKGLEFKQVLLPRLELVDLDSVDSNDPSGVEEHDLMRRSVFVAMTRARDRVWLGGVTHHGNEPWWVASA
jgi:superfamily I DNA/RNA helicase